MYGRFEGMGRMRHGWGGGRAGGAQQEPPPADDVVAWFVGRLPDNWFTTAPDITVDREEILVVGELAGPERGIHRRGSRGPPRRPAASAASARNTRDERIEIARQTEHRYGRKVAWGARSATRWSCSPPCPSR